MDPLATQTTSRDTSCSPPSSRCWPRSFGRRARSASIGTVRLVPRPRGHRRRQRGAARGPARHSPGGSVAQGVHGQRHRLGRPSAAPGRPRGRRLQHQLGLPDVLRGRRPREGVSPRCRPSSSSASTSDGSRSRTRARRSRSRRTPRWSAELHAAPLWAVRRSSAWQKKRALVLRLADQRLPVLQSRFAYNLRQLERLVRVCKRRGLHPVIARDAAQPGRDRARLRRPDAALSPRLLGDRPTSTASRSSTSCAPPLSSTVTSVISATWWIRGAPDSSASFPTRRSPC